MTGATLFLVGWSGVSVIVLGILGARAERRAGGRHAARHAVKAPGLPGGRGEALGFLTRHLCTRGVGRVSLLVLALAGLVWVVAPRGLVGFVVAYALPVALFAAGILALSSLMRVVTLDAPWALVYILYYLLVVGGVGAILFGVRELLQTLLHI
jgi:hypothetical protein